MTGSFVTIDRFEGEKAVIILSDGQTLVIDKKVLPKDSKEGDLVKINFFASRAKTAATQNSVNKLLRKILRRFGHENT
ncbi:MAG: DUF3006 domain-containing protein [Candidatus Parcubacteria bacterium]|nr:DUF3006 domain-containing protein [Candidatus Parcubacteria bacterium]